MHSAACGTLGVSTTDRLRAAVSSTQPAAVIHERLPIGERKKTSAPWEVWLSSRSANHLAQPSYQSADSTLLMRWSRTSSRTGLGGSPARVASSDTLSSR